MFIMGICGLMVMALGWGSEVGGVKPLPELQTIFDPILPKKL